MDQSDNPGQDAAGAENAHRHSAESPQDADPKDTDPQYAAWLHTHVHEPNPAPPSAEPDFVLHLPLTAALRIQLATLAQLPYFTVGDCYIVSTGHGTSGPFAFGGVRLIDLLATYLPAQQPWQHVDVVSADGFGNRLYASELTGVTSRPILLATHVDGAPMSRAQGLVRLIVPNEQDDALRQVKWVSHITVR